MTDRSRFSAASRLAPVLAMLSAACTVQGCSPGVLAPRGPVGEADRAILLDSVAVMLVIVVPTILATLAFAWWYRASNPRARRRPNFAYSGRIELVVWSIPLLVVIFLGGLAWIGSHDLDPARPLPSKTPAIHVQVVSLDWKWLFIYPDQGIATINTLVIPAGAPVSFALTSASVMNAFFIPRLGSMIYTMNGMSSRLNLMADRPGTWWGESTHFSGDGFSGMRFSVRAVPAAQFAAWADSARQTPAILDDAAYRALSLQSRDAPPAVFRLGDANLYDAVTSQRLPPAPGPAAGRPAAAPQRAGA